MINSNDSAGEARLRLNAPFVFTSSGWLLTLILLFASIGTSVVQAAVLTGTVSNKNTQKFLERAVVEVLGTQLTALTAPDGSYRIAGVPAGTYSVTADYTGLEIAKQTVTVGSDDTVTVAFELTSSVYQLNTMVVTTTVEGSAFAVNQQRRAESARSVTSVDAFIDQATGNPGEFLKNVEGIQMDYSQNEPQTIRVRGFDPNLTMVTMDGNEIASAAGSSANRAVQIDQLSIASIESVEVYKAPIPSMSANSIGGQVNFITKSAFDQKGRRAFAQVGVNMDSNDFHFNKTPGPGHGDGNERRVYPAGRLEYSNSFLDNRLGIVASVGLDYTNQLASSTSHELNVTPLPGQTLAVNVAPPIPYTEDNVIVRRGNFSMAPNRQLRVRWDASLNTDFKLSDTIALFLKTTYSDYHSSNRNHGLTLAPGALTADSTVTDYATTSGTASQGVSVFDKYTKSWQINPGMKFRSGDWKVDLVGGFSKSTNHYKNPDNFGGLGINLPAVGWSMSTPRDTDVPTAITQTSGLDFYNLNNYKSTQGDLFSTAGQHRANHNGLVNNNKRDSWDGKYSARFDVQKDFQTRFPSYLKAGLSYNETIFDKNQEQARWYWMGQDGLATADDLTAAGGQFGRFAETNVTQGIPGWNLREPTYLDTNLLYNYWQANPQVLQLNTAFDAQQKIRGKQKAVEKVNGYYFMGNTTIKKLNILAGLRIERTQLRTEGYKVLPTSGIASVLPVGVSADSLQGVLLSNLSVVSKSNYRSDPFKYLHLKYEWIPGLITRASYTDAIGRPNLTDVIPGGQSLDYVNRIVTANNRAGLLPQNSQGLDFSIEYYTKQAGQWTFGVFSRDVKDYISVATVQMTPELMEELNLDSSFSDWQVRTRTNLGKAKWSGFEFKFTQSLREFAFMPTPLHGITLWANYTKISKMEGTFGGTVDAINAGTQPIITELAGVVPELYNAGIKYRTPRGKFEVNLSTNFQGKKPTENMPGVSAAAQRTPYQEDYQFWNMDATYRINNKLSLTVVGRNIFSERPIFSQIGIIRNTQQATGIAWMFAAKYDL